VHFVGADGRELRPAELCGLDLSPPWLLTPDAWNPGGRFAACPAREPGWFSGPRPLWHAFAQPQAASASCARLVTRPDGASFGAHLAICRTSVWPISYLNALPPQERVTRDLLFTLALPGPLRSGLGNSVRPTCRMPDGDERPAEPLVLSTNTFMDLPAARTSSGRRIRARSLARARAYLQMLDQNMRRDALVPAENNGAGRSEQEIQPHRRANLCASCSQWRRTRPRCSPPCWATGALSPVIRWRQSRGVAEP